MNAIYEEIGYTKKPKSEDEELRRRVKDFEQELLNIKRSASTSAADARNTTVVLGGFKGASSKVEMDKWVSHVIHVADAPVPKDIYVKGGFDKFNGVAFAKLSSSGDVSEMVTKIQKVALKYENEK